MSMVPIALGPSLANAGRFADNNNNISDVGKRYNLTQSKSGDVSGVIPSVVENIGKKYIQITGGMYLNIFFNTS